MQNSKEKKGGWEELDICPNPEKPLHKDRRGGKIFLIIEYAFDHNRMCITGNG
jgi:hypothetical protein